MFEELVIGFLLGVMVTWRWGDIKAAFRKKRVSEASREVDV